MRSAEPATKYPVLSTVDVLVTGGGPAGIGAAPGANTLLVENHAFFGGVGAWALGMPINQVRPGGKPRSAIHELLVHKAAPLRRPGGEDRQSPVVVQRRIPEGRCPRCARTVCAPTA
jgi:hypothetical protein